MVIHLAYLLTSAHSASMQCLSYTATHELYNQRVTVESLWRVQSRLRSMSRFSNHGRSDKCSVIFSADGESTNTDICSSYSCATAKSSQVSARSQVQPRQRATTAAYRQGSGFKAACRYRYRGDQRRNRKFDSCAVVSYQKQKSLKGKTSSYASFGGFDVDIEGAREVSFGY